MLKHERQIIPARPQPRDLHIYFELWNPALTHLASANLALVNVAVAHVALANVALANLALAKDGLANVALAM